MDPGFVEQPEQGFVHDPYLVGQQRDAQGVYQGGGEDNGTPSDIPTEGFPGPAQTHPAERAADGNAAGAASSSGVWGNMSSSDMTNRGYGGQSFGDQYSGNSEYGYGGTGGQERQQAYCGPEHSGPGAECWNCCGEGLKIPYEDFMRTYDMASNFQNLQSMMHAKEMELSESKYEQAILESRCEALVGDKDKLHTELKEAIDGKRRTDDQFRDLNKAFKDQVETCRQYQDELREEKGKAKEQSRLRSADAHAYSRLQAEILYLNTEYQSLLVEKEKLRRDLSFHTPQQTRSCPGGGTDAQVQPPNTAPASFGGGLIPGFEAFKQKLDAKLRGTGVLPNTDPTVRQGQPADAKQEVPPPPEVPAGYERKPRKVPPMPSFNSAEKKKDADRSSEQDQQQQRSGSTEFFDIFNGDDICEVCGNVIADNEEIDKCGLCGKQGHYHCITACRNKCEDEVGKANQMLYPMLTCAIF